MRWKAKPIKYCRERNKFCFLPFTWGGTVYWLEWITVCEYLHIDRCDSYWQVYAMKVKS